MSKRWGIEDDFTFNLIDAHETETETLGTIATILFDSSKCNDMFEEHINTTKNEEEIELLKKCKKELERNMKINIELFFKQYE